MQIWTLENADEINEYRAAVGLKPLENLIWETGETNENAPKEKCAERFVERQKGFENWLEKTGWSK